MQEYLDIGHMKKVNNVFPQVLSFHFYLPHHTVFKENSLTWKIRIVLDGSAKSSTGYALNDGLMNGSKHIGTQVLMRYNIPYPLNI